MYASGDKIPTERRKEIINEMIDYIDRERGDDIGIRLLDFFMSSAGKEIYNQGIQDAQKALENSFNKPKYDLDDLQE